MRIKIKMPDGKTVERTPGRTLDGKVVVTYKGEQYEIDRSVLDSKCEELIGARWA